MQKKEIYAKIDVLKSKNEVYGLGHKEEDFKLFRKRIDKFMKDTAHLKDIDLKAVIGVFNKKGIIIRKSKGDGNYDLITQGSTKGVSMVKGEDYGLLFINDRPIKFVLEKEDWDYIPQLLHGFTPEPSSYYDNDDRNISIIKTKQELKEKVLKTIEKNKDGSYRKEELDAFCRLMGTEYDEKNLEQPMDTYHFKKIAKVIELDNKRIYVQTRGSKEKFNILSVTPDEQHYNYVDEGRIIYDDCIYLADDLMEQGYDREVLSKIKRSYQVQNFMAVDVGIYHRAERRFKLEKRKADEEKELKNIMEAELSKKVEKVDKVDFKYQNIHFTNHYITYEKQQIGGPKTKLKGFIKEKVIFSERMDFNDIFNNFVDALEMGWKGYATKEYVFTLGRVSAELGLVNTETKIGTIQTRYTINGIRVNRDERKECLQRALCYDKQNDYNDFLTTVSKCSLRFYKYINNGLKLRFRDEQLGDEEMNLRLKIIRKKNLNYIKLPNDRLVQVKDSNKLFKMGTDERFRHYLNYEELFTFFGEEYGLKNKEFSLLIKESIKEYKEALRKSEELLKKVVKQYKCKHSELTDKGEQHTGYTIKGLSGKEYFVSESTSSNQAHAVHPVWDISNKEKPRFICIVDKSLGKDIGKDKLVARICALANDELLVSDINTLGL